MCIYFVQLYGHSRSPFHSSTINYVRISKSEWDEPLPLLLLLPFNIACDLNSQIVHFCFCFCFFFSFTSLLLHFCHSGDKNAINELNKDIKRNKMATENEKKKNKINRNTWFSNIHAYRIEMRERKKELKQGK